MGPGDGGYCWEVEDAGQWKGVGVDVGSNEAVYF